MARTPTLRPREVIAILTALGFQEVRQRGSHKRFRHPDGRATTVPVHASGDLPPFLLHQIARQVGLGIDDFLAHR